MSAVTQTPFNVFRAVSPSNTIDIWATTPVSDRKLTDALKIGDAGTVAVVSQSDEVTTFTCVAGELLPVAIKRVNLTGTSATAIVALWLV